MRYRAFGQTGFQVSEIGLGCASFWGKTIFDEREAIRLVHTAVGYGVNFFDTGASYSGGNAEPRLGKALAGIPDKHHLIVATKAGTCIGNRGKLYKDFSPLSIRKSIEASLLRLGLESIPLLQLHGPQIADLNDTLLETLERLKSEGKVRHFGVNSFTMQVIEHVAALPVFGVAMIDYNILRPKREPVIEMLAARKFGVLAGMALAGGLYSPTRFRVANLRDGWYALRALKNHHGDILSGRRYRFITEIDGWTGAQVALAWVLRNKHVSSAVIGTTRMEHLHDAVQASGRILDTAILQRMEQAA